VWTSKRCVLKKKTKNTFSVHHWCGLIAGIFLLAISLSGSLLVFHDEIDAAFYQDELLLPEPVDELSIDRSLEKIRSNHPGWEIRIPGLPESKDEALKYELRQGTQRKWLMAHPSSGEILHKDDTADKRLVNVLLTLHYSIFAGTTGKVFVFLCGLAFLVLLVTGVILYRKSFFKVISFRQGISIKSRKSFFSSLHRILGVWGLFFNILIGITGLWMAYVVINSALKTSDALPDTPPTVLSIDRVLEQVKARQPGFEVHYLRFPATPEERLSISGRMQTDPAYYGRYYSRLQVNYRTGEIEQMALLRDKPLLDRFTTILQPLHFGNYAGLLVKIIYSLGGVLPGILSVSGFLIWMTKKGNRELRPDSKKGNKYSNEV
jgi:uncharacterized iron-regulated membrane protein